MGATGAVQGFFKAYFKIEDARDEVIDSGTFRASFPNTMATISEVDHVPMNEVLWRILYHNFQPDNFEWSIWAKRGNDYSYHLISREIVI